MKNKTLLCACLLLVFLTIVHVAIVRHYRHKKNEDVWSGIQKPTNIVIEERLEKQIAALKKMTLQDALKYLYKMEYYSWPGAFIGTETMFFQSADGRIAETSRYEHDTIELKKILSSRLFRKCYQDLQRLPKEQAAKIIRIELETALSAYRKLYDGFFDRKSLDFSIEDSRDGSPMLPGLRFKIFSLILIAGSLELPDVQKTMDEIITISEEQTAKIVQLDDLHLVVNYQLGATLCNNIILTAGLYGTSPLKSSAELKPYTDRFVEHQLVDFSAPATEYDVLVRRGMQEVNPDKEYINIRYFEQVTDEDLDVIRRLVHTQ